MIGIEVDATDIDRRIVSVKQTIPVAGPGPLILLYPQWIPGNHGPVGPVDDIADLRITANGQPLRWVRNTVEHQRLRGRGSGRRDLGRRRASNG